ncbi:hypothetical protein DPMN_176218 [Dreissena polymorpha]|uniref:Uncharacterized protein n=1 Tax=Dreissena polymorpha TaxID=45954 RepID=A0A9D4EAJ5_DREPO|nr:hypothetical protein DPMN_176218 [Dreissena polymorpha]
MKSRAHPQNHVANFKFWQVKVSVLKLLPSGRNRSTTVHSDAATRPPMSAQTNLYSESLQG